MGKTLLNLLILFTIAADLFSKPLPLNYNLINYTLKDYHGSSVNWEIDSDSLNIYVANNDGLLIFNGNNWNRYNISSQKHLRSVHVIKDRVYTAGEDNIGFWKKDAVGNWNYTSILSLLKENTGNMSDTYWSITHDNKYIYFQSFSKILMYDGKTLKVLDRNCNMPFYKNRNNIYVHRLFKGIYTLNQAHFTHILDNSYVQEEELKFLLSPNDSIDIVGMNKGLVFTRDQHNRIVTLDNIKKTVYPYEVSCGTLLKNQYLVLGTLGGGLFIFDLQGNLIQQINGKNNLQSNIINHIQVIADNLWVTMDCGIARINTNPTVFLWKKTNEIGILSSASFLADRLYLGTNQGLYSFHDGDLHKVNHYMGAVFCLKSIRNNLFCGGSDGAFLKEGNADWKKISDTKGFYDLQYMAQDGHEFMIAPSYTYITYLTNKNGKWHPNSDVRDFLNTLTQLTPENLHILWAINLQDGIYRIKINSDLNKLESFKNYGKVKGLTDFEHINIENIDGNILFFSPEGVFKFDSETDRFVKNKKLSEALDMAIGSQWMTHTIGNEYWFAKDNELYIYEIHDNDAKYIGSICLNEYNHTLLEQKTEVFNVAPFLYLISSAEGTLVVNKKNIFNNKGYKETISLSHIKYYQNGVHYADINNLQNIRIPYNNTDLEIALSKSIHSKSCLLKYKILSDTEGSWSDWSSNGIIALHKLPIGTHQILIADYFGNSLMLKIIVPPPFYLSLTAIFGYILIFGFIVFYITRRIQHIKRQRIIKEYEEEQRKKDEEIVRLYNERLKETVHTQQSEINEKLRAISQKQELLLNIGDELDRQKEKLGDRYPKKEYEKLRKIINEGMSSETDFMLFQNYYQEINHDFMLHLKDVHPDLTPGELKFCCLIRSNLSTKDIASILNITIRGVELKKYRLKKKLNLDEENIYDYILKL